MKDANVTLLVPRLDFVNTGSPKIHARDVETETKITMCGKGMMPQDSIMSERTLKSSRLCKRCFHSLVTYTGRLGSTPKVRIEREAQV